MSHENTIYILRWARETSEKFVYKHSETIKCVKN